MHSHTRALLFPFPLFLCPRPWLLCLTQQTKFSSSTTAGVSAPRGQRQCRGISLLPRPRHTSSSEKPLRKRCVERSLELSSCYFSLGVKGPGPPAPVCPKARNIDCGRRAQGTASEGSWFSASLGVSSLTMCFFCVCVPVH